MTDNSNSVSTIQGIIHPLQVIIDAFTSAGAELIFQFNNYDFIEDQVNPEWNYLTFRIQ